MRRPLILTIAVSILLGTLAGTSPARRTTMRVQPTNETPGHRLLPPSATTGGSPKSVAALDTLILGEWDFEDGLGGPDPQGWTIWDVTAQLDTFFHVDDFAGLGSPWAPLAGSKSMWCGTRTSPPNQPYAAAPGYGHLWRQLFESQSFATTGAVTVSFKVRYDSEPDYDFTYFEYLSKTGTWQELLSFSGVGESLATATVLADSLAGSVRLRFLFVSDNSWDNEDGLSNSSGAIVIDSLTVSDTLGILDFQDFESESVGALTTADGDWMASVPPAYGDYAALLDGSSVLQEDSLVTNASHLWAFFNGSTATYACGGHPEQTAVPFGREIDGYEVALNNRIISPLTSLSALPGSTEVFLEFDVYRDLPLDNLVAYVWHVRSFHGTTAGPWVDRNLSYLGPSPQWFHYKASIGDLIEPGATQIQVALGARDLCPWYCGSYGTGACHSHAPLIDNVTLRSVAAAFVVTNTNNAGAGSLRQAIIDANLSSQTNAIVFNIPIAGPHIITPNPALPDITRPLIIDGYTQPGSSPNSAGAWESGNAVLQVMLDGSSIVGTNQHGLLVAANNCTIRGLAIGNFSGDGIILASDSSVVEGCHLGTDVTGTIAAPNGVGVSTSAIGQHNVVGGADPDARNVISGNVNEGLFLGYTSHQAQGNLIGVDASGTSSLGNGTYGVRMLKSVDCDLWSNLISGNGLAGVGIFGPTVTSDIRAQSNRIGTDITGTAPLGNAGDGIRISSMLSGGNDIVIGGKGLLFNLIAYNGGNGIAVATPATGAITIYENEIRSNTAGIVVTQTTGNGIVSIQHNKISDNTGLGIDLGDDGVTANDAQDVDSGPNGLQNFPVLTSATGNGGTSVTMVGTLNSTPNTNFAIEFFSSPACDGSGFGEGATYHRSPTSVTTNGSGDAIINATFDTQIPGGHYVTATARPGLGGTSEFSACIMFINTPTGSGVSVTPVDPTTGAKPATLTFDNVTAPGNTSLTTSSACASLPGHFLAPDSLCYDLSTTATFTGNVEVCFSYDESLIQGSEANVRLIHYDATLLPPAWVDITTSVDTVANSACGSTATLSPFVIGTGSVTAVGDTPAPRTFALLQNVPNPFNPTTVISYDVPSGGADVSIRIYDVAGRLVQTLVDTQRPAGHHQVPWNGRNTNGQQVATGVYFYRMQAGRFVQTRKMVLLK